MTEMILAVTRVTDVLGDGTRSQRLLQGLKFSAVGMLTVLAVLAVIALFTLLLSRVLNRRQKPAEPAAAAPAPVPAQPEAPVEPVSPARSVKRDESVRVPVSVQEPRIPGEEALNNAVDNLSRMRIQYEGRDNTAAQALAQFGANAY